MELGAGVTGWKPGDRVILPAAAQTAWQALFEHADLQAGVDVSAAYPLSQAASVHELGAAGEIRGKVLLHL